MILIFMIILAAISQGSTTKLRLRDFTPTLSKISKSLNDIFKVSVLAGSNDIELDLEVFLYTNYSILTTCPSNSNFYNCSQDPDCSFISQEPTIHNYIFDSIQAFDVEMPIFFSNNNWGSNNANLLYTNSCTEMFLNSNISGAIGLGTEGVVSNLFMQYTNFSVQLDDDSDGLIIFGISNDFENYQQAAFISQDVSGNWEISVSSVYAGQTIDVNHLIVFDVTFEYIGIPKSLYLEIIYWLSNNSVVCDHQNTTLPTFCEFSGLTALLPSIYFYTSSISPIEISPAIYLKSNLDGYVLNFVGTDPNDPNYVTVNPNYENYIIFGVSFLEKFFPIFDFSNPRYPTIVIFESTYSVLNNPSNIVFIIMMGILGGACLYSVIKLSKKQDKLYSDLRNSLLEADSVVETPGRETHLGLRDSSVN